MLKFHNTLSGKLEEFQPIKIGHVLMYTCGPTVYNIVHIGNFRTFMFEDILRRYLKFKGFNVVQVMNLTDVDDKTIKGAVAKGVSLKEYTDEYIRYFFEDLDALNIERAEYYPRATDYIDDMVDIIKSLIEKGVAYENDGSIYFNINKFKDYGKLSKIDLTQMKSGARYDADEYDKHDVRDFVLWKKTKEDESIFWDTDLGRGRPGWHIECSAMSQKILGDHFDIHTGGVDNIFPHHENEIAQSEMCTGHTFVNYWLHSAHLKIKEDKMSKSLGNFITPRDLFNRGINPKVVRYILLSVHYRSSLHFDEDEIPNYEKALTKIQCVYDTVFFCNADKNGDQEDVTTAISIVESEFENCMDNDLNMSGALGAIHVFIKTIDGIVSNGLSGTDREKILTCFNRINQVLGVIEETPEEDAKIRELVEQREAARNDRRFSDADYFRDELLKLGIVVEDTPSGPRWKRKR